MRTCKCGCGTIVSVRRTFVNKQHQLAWMHAGGARELNALLPEAVRQHGGRTAGRIAHESGRLREASAMGIARIKEIVAEVREAQGVAESETS